MFFYVNNSRVYSTGLVEKAFNAGLATAADLLSVWMSFIEYLVRKCTWGDSDNENIVQLREAFTRATEHLDQSRFYSKANGIVNTKTITFLFWFVAYDVEGDPECTLLQYWAYFEAKKLNNMPKARELWSKIISRGHSKSAQWWLARVQFERLLI